MFACLIERTVNTGKRAEVVAILNEMLPTVKKQQGFLDAILLTDDTYPHYVATMTLWATEEDLENFYGSREFQTEVDRLTPLMESTTTHTCTVEASTLHKVAEGKAA